MLSGSSYTVAVRVAGWLVLVGVGALAHPAPPDRYVTATMIAAAVVGALAFGETFTSIWRGPPVISFAPEDTAVCDELGSEPVRAYAQLRGTIGGAGHVHPRRLVLPLVAWGAALVAGARPLWPALEGLGAVPAAIAASTAFATWLFPARPYWYREVMGGGAVVSPPEALAALAARERREQGPALAAIHAQGRADPLLRTPAFDPRLTVVPPGAAPYAPRAATRRAPRVDAAAPGTQAPARARARPPRYLAERRIVVQQDGFEFQVATVNVSDGGLAVRWPAELPVVGEDVVVKIEDGDVLGELEAEVRWNRDGAGRERLVGLRIAPDGDAGRAWRALVRGAARPPSA